MSKSYQMKNKILLVVCGIIAFLLIMIGSIYVHEYYHKYEMRNIEKTSDSLCVSLLLNCDGQFGYYRVEGDNEQEHEKALKIMENWENRAYFVQLMFVVDFNLIILLVVCCYNLRRKDISIELKGGTE